MTPLYLFVPLLYGNTTNRCLNSRNAKTHNVYARYDLPTQFAVTYKGGVIRAPTSETTMTGLISPP